MQLFPHVKSLLHERGGKGAGGGRGGKLSEDSKVSWVFPSLVLEQLGWHSDTACPGCLAARSGAGRV